MERIESPARRPRIPARPALALALALLSAGCYGAGDRPPERAPAGENHAYLAGPGHCALSGLVLIPAVTERDKALGLQFVTGLPEDTGVIFFIERPRSRPVAFHSRNCYFTIGMTALDADGRILAVKNLEPESLAEFPPETAFVVETAPGRFPGPGKKPGESVDLGRLMLSIDYRLNVRDHLPRRPEWPEGRYR